MGVYCLLGEPLSWQTLQLARYKAFPSSAKHPATEARAKIVIKTARKIRMPCLHRGRAYFEGDLQSEADRFAVIQVTSFCIEKLRNYESQQPFRDKTRVCVQLRPAVPLWNRRPSSNPVEDVRSRERT